MQTLFYAALAYAGFKTFSGAPSSSAGAPGTGAPGNGPPGGGASGPPNSYQQPSYGYSLTPPTGPAPSTSGDAASQFLATAIQKSANVMRTSNLGRGIL